MWTLLALMELSLLIVSCDYIWLYFLGIFLNSSLFYSLICLYHHKKSFKSCIFTYYIRQSYLLLSFNTIMFCLFTLYCLILSQLFSVFQVQCFKISSRVYPKIFRFLSAKMRELGELRQTVCHVFVRMGFLLKCDANFLHSPFHHVPPNIEIKYKPDAKCVILSFRGRGATVWWIA